MAPTRRRPRPNRRTRTELTLPISNRAGLGRAVQRLRAGIILPAAVLSLHAAGTGAALPATDRSLTATDTGTNAPPLVSNLTVTPDRGRLSLAPLSGTNLDNVPDLAPTVPTTVVAAPPDPSALDPSQKAGVGGADVVPATGLAGLSREELEKRIATLSDDLIAANAESEYFRQQWQDLRLRDEALGVEALTVDERKLEDKLVQAVKESYQSEMRRREALLLLDRLRTTTEALLKTAPKYDPKTRADYEVAMRASRDYLAGRNGTAIPLGLSLGDAQIADLDPQLNAAVLNVGKAQGVKEGMPFLVYQNNQQVGVLKIVLARELVSAALVESLQPNVTLKAGDRVAVETQ